MIPTDGIQYASQFQLDDLTLIAVNGTSVDLREVMREMNIFEDMFTNTMSGDLFISDSQNLINLLPIIGGEYLKVTLSKPSFPWKLDKVFQIYKITDRRKATAFAENYILHFCSVEQVLSDSTRISKSYRGMSISKIVEDITTNYLHINSKKFPSSAIDSTTGNFDIVIPFWTPFYAINWLSRMARSAATPGCSYVFFEDSVGYHFTSIESLSQQEPLQPINLMPMNLAGETGEQSPVSDTQQRLESAEEYEMVGSPDLLRFISTGVYGGKLLTVNPIDQRIKSITMNAAVLFDATDHTNPNMFLQLGSDRTKKPQTEHHDSFFRIAADNLKVDTWLLQRNAYISAFHGFQVKVSVPGNLLLRVGQIVQLNLPAATLGSKAEKPIDEMFSGNYMISAIRHKIDRVRYVCILELSKDSLVPQLPPSLESSSAMNRIRES